MSQIKKQTIGHIPIYAINDFSESQELFGENGFFSNVPKHYIDQLNYDCPDYLNGNCINEWTYYCYLIEDEGRYILIDTGVGNAHVTNVPTPNNWHGTLLHCLKTLGVSPDQIDTVFMTHIHADHIGWNVINRQGTIQKTFPNAQYICPKADYYAYHDGITAAAIPQECFDLCIESLVRQGCLQLIDAVPFSLTSHITAYPAPGHTPGTMVVNIVDGDKCCILTGDAFVSPLQILTPECVFIYDIDPVMSTRQKRSLLSLNSKHIPFLLGGCHFGLGYVEQQSDTVVWHAI